jgi:hypothetical protein
MAEARLVTNSDGIVVSPARWAGRHVNEVMDYLEGLEAAVTNDIRGETPPAETPPAETPKEPQTPQERLAAAANARMDPMQQAFLHRAIIDDEDTFAATVTDYEKYREDIHKVRANLQPAQLMQRGLHRTLYINIKTTKDKSVQDRVFAPVEVTAPPPPNAEPPAAVPAAPAVEPQRVGPRPAPPLASPTPAARAAAPAPERKAKLIASDKVREFCRQTNQDVDAYLLRLEESGMTQEEINNAGQLGKRNFAEGRKLVYDRPRAKA